MITVLLLSCVLANSTTELPESGFGTPTYLMNLGVVGHIAVPCIFACLILLVCYPDPRLINYQMSLISTVGICLGLHHMILSPLPKSIQAIILIPSAVAMCVLSLRKETRILAFSISNTYLGGYLTLMLLGIKYKIFGIPVMVVYGLLVYFLISTVEAVFVNVIRSTSCTFFLLCFLAPIGPDAFKNMLSYSFYRFDPMRIIATTITVGAFVFFFCLPIFINVLLEKTRSPNDSELEGALQKDVDKEKIEVV